MHVSLVRLVLVSAFMTVLGVATVYGIRFEFQLTTVSKPSSASNNGQTKPSSSSTSLQTTSSSESASEQTNNYSPGGAPMPIPLDSYVLVFAHDGDGFVQASVTIAGPIVNGTELENQTLFSNGTTYDVDSFNGTTTTDLQNPLILELFPEGVYTLSATFESAPVQNLTLKVTGYGSCYQAVFNFGSSAPPPMGHLLISAFASYPYAGGGFVGTFVPASVTITGPAFFNTTLVYNLGFEGSAVFTVPPGAYMITATYGSFQQQTSTANVTDGGFSGAFFCFGGPPPP